MGGVGNLEREWGEFLMAEYLAKSEDLTAVADAIRAKGGTDAQLTFPDGFVSAVQAITTGGGDLLAARVTNTLTTYSNATITRVTDCGFADCTALVSVDLPAVTHIKSQGFARCTNLESINFPMLVSIGNNCFRNCAKLTEFVTGSHFDSRIDQSTFEGCKALTKVDFHHVNKQGFNGYSMACANLITLVIRNVDAVPPMTTTYTFGAATTKMNKGEGYIYVPATMVAAYKAATNWAKFADQIRAIEDYPGITGG